MKRLLTRSGAEERPYFEPLLLEYLAHFNNLMEAYQAREVEQWA